MPLLRWIEAPTPLQRTSKLLISYSSKGTTQIWSTRWKMGASLHYFKISSPNWETQVFKIESKLPSNQCGHSQGPKYGVVANFQSGNSRFNTSECKKSGCKIRLFQDCRPDTC